MFNTVKRDERGFSLIELAVVVAIIGILAAIAIPTFLGQRAGAQDRQVHSALRNVMTIAKAAAANADDGNYPDLADIQAADPSFNLGDFSDPQNEAPFTVSTGPNEIVALVTGDDRVLTLAALSASGTCWVVRTPLDAATTYGKYVPDADGTANTADDDCGVSTIGTAQGDLDEDALAEGSFGSAGELEIIS